MNADWTILLILSGCFLALFTIAELLYRLLKITAEYTRKLVHIVTGLLTMLFPLYLQHFWQVVLICASFLVLLLLSQRYRFLESINAIGRRSHGSILYPVIVILVFAFYLRMKAVPTQLHPYAYFYLPILLMAVCDPVAALSGTFYQRRHPMSRGKTRAGTLAFFITAFCLSAVLLFGFHLHTLHSLLFWALVLALSTAVAERYSGGGWDNFTIPLTAAIMLYCFTLFCG